MFFKRRWPYSIFLLCSGQLLYSSELFRDKSNLQNEKYIFKKENLSSPESQGGEEIQVIAIKPGKGAKGTYQNISFRQSSEAKAAVMVSEVIERQVGLRLNRYGPPGTFSQLSIRGAHAEQVGIFLDGIPLNDPHGGAVNLENLPTALLEKAELYRSFTPLHLAGSYPGGALDLIPITSSLAAHERQLQLSSSLSSLQGASLGIGYLTGGHLQFVSLAASQNRYTYLDDQGTPYFNQQDDIVRWRKNEDFSQTSYTGIFQWQPEASRVKLLLDIFSKEQGLPGVVGQETSQVRLKTLRGQSQWGFQKALGSSFLLDIHSWLQFNQTDLLDPQRELAVGFSEQQRQRLSLAVGAAPLWFALETLSLRFLLQGRLNRLFLDQEILAERMEADSGLTLDWQIFSFARLNLLAKANFIADSPQEGLKKTPFAFHLKPQRQTQPVGQVKLSLAPAYFVTPNWQAQEFEVFASLTYGERFPSLSESYGDGALLLPAPDLRKEQVFTRALGIEGKFSCLLLQCVLYLSYYQTEMQNLILLVANSQKTMLAVNVGKAYLAGIENEIKLAYKSLASLIVRYGYLHAQDKGNLPFYYNKYLPYRPRHSFNFILDLLLLQKTHNQLYGFTGMDYLGANYRDRYNSYYLYLPQRTRWLAGLHWKFGRQLTQEITLTIKNITGERQVDVIGYPLPGRVWEIQYRQNWDWQSSNLTPSEKRQNL